MRKKYVDIPVSEIDKREDDLDKLPPFDTFTKVRDTYNCKVELRVQVLALVKAKKKAMSNCRSYATIEREALELLDGERNVVIPQILRENIERVFELSKNRKEQHLDTVELDKFFDCMVEDEFINSKLSMLVRKSVDGELETLDQLMFRVNDLFKKDRISLQQFYSYFASCGLLRDGDFPIRIDREITEDQESVKGFVWEKEDAETLLAELDKQLKHLLIEKQNRVEKLENVNRHRGKGKYGVVMPSPFKFMVRCSRKQKPSRRAIWLQKEVEARKKEEESHINFRFKANEIPRTTTQPLYEKYKQRDAERRAKNKEANMARTKTREKLFSFYERELKQQREKAAMDLGDIDDTMLNQFRARIIPWRILVPRFRMMMEKEEHDREQRIKKNAENSYKMAKLPPRMQAYEDERKRRIEENLDSTVSEGEPDLGFSFQPPRARSVPNFRQLQKAFVTSMEKRKKEVKVTEPKPFKFHQNKPSAELRTYMDQMNQAINPTIKKSASVGRKRSPVVRDNVTEQPATTAKHEAYVNARRAHMEARKAKEVEDLETNDARTYKQTRLQNRVKCSPAIMSNVEALKQRRKQSLAKAKRDMKDLEQIYDNIKAGIEYNVANRPLLVEQVSKAFIHNLEQIKELQKYVTILREAGLNPDDHLTEEQRELLISADYYDKLNMQTAYFPEHGQSFMPQPEGTNQQIQEMAEEQEEGDDEEQEEYPAQEGMDQYDAIEEEGDHEEMGEEMEQEEQQYDQEEDEEEDDGVIRGGNNVESDDQQQDADEYDENGEYEQAEDMDDEEMIEVDE